MADFERVVFILYFQRPRMDFWARVGPWIFPSSELEETHHSLEDALIAFVEVREREPTWKLRLVEEHQKVRARTVNEISPSPDEEETPMDTPHSSPEEAQNAAQELRADEGRPFDHTRHALELLARAFDKLRGEPTTALASSPEEDYAWAVLSEKIEGRCLCQFFGIMKCPEHRPSQYAEGLLSEVGISGEPGAEVDLLRYIKSLEETARAREKA